MSILATLALFISPLLVIFAFLNSSAAMGSFWHGFSCLFVILGSIASAVVSFGLKRVYFLCRIFSQRLGGYRVNYAATTMEILSLARAKRSGYNNFVAARKNIRNVFLKECAELLDWGEAEVSRSHLRTLLETRSKVFNIRYTHDAEVFEAVSKFPVIYGGIGSLLLILPLLLTYNKHPGIELLIYGFGRALLPLLYGMFFSYIFLLPIYRNLEEAAREDHTMREMVVQGIMMIQEGVQQKFIEEEILSFLLPHERKFIISPH